MPKIEQRLTRLEQIVEKHLEQSGFIQSDLGWLKKAFWVLSGAGLTFNVTLAVAIIQYLIRK